MVNREIKELNDTEWLLLRPQNIIGSTQEIKQTGFILKGSKFVYEDYYIVPGLLKIINEIIDNSVDVFIKSEGKSATKIDVTITDITVKVKDNGYGIPVEKNKNGKYIPEIAWGRPRAGSNFDDKNHQAQLGANGVGSYATAVFSKEFIGTTCDGKNKLVVKFKDNLEKVEVSKPVPCKMKGTLVEFKPDLTRFGLTKITETYKNAIKQRLMHIAYSYPGITFRFNNEVIKSDPKSYFSKFGDNVTLFQGKNFSVAFLPNDSDDFVFFSYINGLYTPEGGTQIDYFLDKVIPPIKDKIAKKYKSIKNGDIKNKLKMIVIFKDFKEPKFNSQTKERFTSPYSKISDHIGKVDFNKWGDILYKNKAIINDIIEIYKIKEAFKEKKELEKLKDTKKRVKSDKYTPPTKKRKYLMICEGACLSEETEILTSFNNKKKLKDLEIGDKVINSDGSVGEVYSMRTSLKKGLKIKTSKGDITISEDHRMFVYDTENSEIVFRSGKEILEQKDRYKFLKSKLDERSEFLLVTKVHIEEDGFRIETDKNDVFLTENDKIVVVRDGSLKRIHGSELKEFKDFLIFSEK